MSPRTYIITEMANGRFRFECQAPNCWAWSDHDTRQGAEYALKSHERSQDHTALRRERDAAGSTALMP